MKKKIIISLILILGIVGSTILYFYLDMNGFFFDPGDRYESTELNYMDVIYEESSDIYAVNGGWSSTNSCPWARAHEGFDFALNNDTNVLAAAPGQVETIRYNDWGTGAENRYMVELNIRFNKTILVDYAFEPWTTDANDFEHQKRLITVQEGDWVSLGQEIGTFLNIGSGSHVHFDVKEKNIRVRVDKYYNDTVYAKMMDLVHIYHPEWNRFCFDENTPLDYMQVIYENQADIYALNEAYSNTTDCPWGFVHQGFDFAFKNNSKVLAAAPGQVTKIEQKDYGEGMENRYTIGIIIQFNDSTLVQYTFEPWTNKTADNTKQLSMIVVHEGDWVMPGREIGYFLNNGSGAHVDFNIQINNVFQPLTQFYLPSEATELLSMIHVHQPTWNYIDYVGQPW